MRIVDIREQAHAISRYLDPTLPSGGLTTSAVAVVTDVVRHGKPVVGFGFSSIGRFAQSGLIRERFAPRLFGADTESLLDEARTNFDPFRAWTVMMAGEKPGGHGERCVAVGTLDMALWDATAKIAGVPLYHLLAERFGNAVEAALHVPVYAGGGYPYPHHDMLHLAEEIQRLGDLGYRSVKIKVGSIPPERDAERIETVLRHMPPDGRVAIDAMNSYDSKTAPTAASTFAQYPLWWFEDICDPLDFQTLSAAASGYKGAIAAGEALFSAAEAALLLQHGGLRPDRDILLFDPVHCYGLPGYLAILKRFEAAGWSRAAFWPHGGHLFCLHVVAGLGLGGAEVNPLCFQPFGGLADGGLVSDGHVAPPEGQGIGFEAKSELARLFEDLVGE
jgi:L-alanine-DL-glutamate epimerase-like enolase superfamily enzyme